MDSKEQIGRCSIPALGDVHIWRITTQSFEFRNDVLAMDERRRATRLRFRHDRRCFIAARAATRSILGLYLDIKPEEIKFSYSLFGKPALQDHQSATDLKFNLSHSEDYCLLALTSVARVGVDIEFVRPGFATDEMVRRVLSRGEHQDFFTLPPDEREAAFFRYWTRKEACAKAWGYGLSLPLDSFEVLIPPGEAARLLSAKKRLFRCTVYEVPSPIGYCAAVAVEGSQHNLRYRTWR